MIHEDDMERGSGKPPFFDGTNYPYWKIRMSVHLHGSIGLSGRFARILLTLCLNLVPVPLKNKRTGTTQIVELAVFFSQVFFFRSSRESPIVRLSGDMGEASKLS